MARLSPPPVACEPEDGVEVEVEVVVLALALEVALDVPSALAVAGMELVIPTEVVDVELTSLPVPQGMAEPSGWVLSAAGTMSVAVSVIVNLPVQTLLLEAGEENW
jgi:hypothetical protein